MSRGKASNGYPNDTVTKWLRELDDEGAKALCDAMTATKPTGNFNKIDGRRSGDWYSTEWGRPVRPSEATAKRVLSTRAGWQVDVRAEKADAAATKVQQAVGKAQFESLNASALASSPDAARQRCAGVMLPVFGGAIT